MNRNEQILKNAGYRFHEVREMWFSGTDRKAFSHEVLRDRDERWLVAKLTERVPEGEFYFYRNTSDIAVCSEILQELQLSNLIPTESLT
jgi:hypothetical protein